ncbi:MAG: acyl-CoA dehydrogenase family protein [Rhodococcus sp.]|jgi:alkylation response protein AidB-like acyl-CoA dehydrogenase|uniref:acyl-CoA dehydrogenase family protein n=1 Tax=Rhodococcus TaxID=1827 RepID=UPI001C4E2A37|nr:acyl-CoA dehydrogenase family protein [Rhodococcus qingshengii]MCW0191447.1 acyl-CoA dehydrogenase family protein [Rhodococcus sp. (in: high G+C Gram-positive bacteria)]
MAVTTESVEDFRLRARGWLAANMPRFDPDAPAAPEGDDDAMWLRTRELQKMLYAGGFAGICYPVEYGGLGLTPAHQEAFTEEAIGYELPLLLNVPTFTICAPTILDMGNEQQKRDRIGAAIRGDEILVQFLSEPSGGSDLAGLITRAERDGDEWILNGAKTWSTSAYAADWALCLARTDWDAPKHRGLTMFLLKVDSPGVTIRRIKQVNGSTEFCEEFFDNVVIPADCVVGEVNDGWSVASRQLFHERTAVGGGSQYSSGVGVLDTRNASLDFVELAKATGQNHDVRVRERVGEAYAHRTVQDQLIKRVTGAVESGEMPGPAMSLIRLFHAETDWLNSDVALDLAGSESVVGPLGERGAADMGQHYLSRQGASLGGGSSEMSRNIISERLLQMPREYAADRDVPFKDVKRGR